MKVIRYYLCTNINYGTEEEPKIVENLSPVKMGWSKANEEIAKKEAHNGEYTIEDDGVEEVTEPTAQDDTDAMLIDHEYRLTMLELFSDMTE